MPYKTGKYPSIYNENHIPVASEPPIPDFPTPGFIYYFEGDTLDSSGNNKHLTADGVPDYSDPSTIGSPWTQNVYNLTVTTFPAINDLNINSAGPWSWGLWFSNEAIQSASYVTLIDANLSTLNLSFNRSFKTGKMAVRLNSSGIIGPVGGFNNKSIVHLVLTKDVGNNIKAYVNGSEDSNHAYAGNGIFSGISELNFGGFPVQELFLVGQVLTAEQILYLSTPHRYPL